MGFDIHQQIFDEGGDYQEKRLAHYREQLVTLFEKSPEGQALLDEDVSLFWADTMLDFSLRYLGVTPPDMSPEDLREILFDLIPAKVSAPPEDAHEAVRELHAFWTFLQREFGLESAAACLKLLDDKAARKLERAMGDPRNFGMAKSIVAMGRERGFDMTTEEGINRWMETYNAEVMAGRGLPVPLPGERGRRAQKARQKMKRQMQKDSRRRNRQKKKKR
jgi:hypothetical protein